MPKLHDRVKIIHIEGNHRLIVKAVVRVSDDLNKEYRRQARLYAEVSGFYVRAKRRVRQLKSEMEMLCSRLRRIIRREEEGRVTKDDYQAAFMRKKSYRVKLKELDDAIFDEESLAGILKALDHKKEMLVGLGANMRHELPDELRLLERSIKDRVRKRKDK